MAEEQLNELAAMITAEPATETEESTQDAEQTGEDQSASEDAKQDDQVEEPAKLTVKQLAEKLKMTPEQVYASLSIKVGDSEVSLADFKDKAKDLHKASELRESAHTHKTDAENEILRQRREIALAQQRYQPTDAEKQQSELDHQSYIEGENALALQAIPEWKDPAVQKAGLDGIAELLNHYAFSPAETSTLLDHRFLKLMHDFASIRTRLAKAQKSVVKGKSTQTSKGKRTTPATGSDKAVQLHKAGKLDQTSAVAAIIADGMRP